MCEIPSSRPDRHRLWSENLLRPWIARKLTSDSPSVVRWLSGIDCLSQRKMWTCYASPARLQPTLPSGPGAEELQKSHVRPSEGWLGAGGKDPASHPPSRGLSELSQKLNLWSVCHSCWTESRHGLCLQIWESGRPNTRRFWRSMASSLKSKCVSGMCQRKKVQRPSSVGSRSLPARQDRQ